MHTTVHETVIFRAYFHSLPKRTPFGNVSYDYVSLIVDKYIHTYIQTYQGAYRTTNVTIKYPIFVRILPIVSQKLKILYQIILKKLPANSHNIGPDHVWYSVSRHSV